MSWLCDYCGKEFRTKKACENHELSCKLKEEKNRAVKGLMSGLGIIGLYFLYPTSFGLYLGIFIISLSIIMYFKKNIRDLFLVD